MICRPNITRVSLTPDLPQRNPVEYLGRDLRSYHRYHRYGTVDDLFDAA
ncbi:MAG: hypothetical protein NTW75_05210 [Planctomycetales bacterium]|nr:hypothetical protein [Planctomycetales bacterium]